jgi:hypothetical protein
MASAEGFILLKEASIAGRVLRPVAFAFLLDAGEARTPELGGSRSSLVAGCSIMGALLNLFLLIVVVLGFVACVFAPVAVLGVMFWKWHKELAESLRLRQARSTQVR